VARRAHEERRAADAMTMLAVNPALGPTTKQREAAERFFGARNPKRRIVWVEGIPFETRV
jgi:hypothetical protein